MVHIDGVDVCARVEEHARHFDVGGEMERELPVAAARVDRLRIVAKNALDFVEHTKARRRVQRQHRAAFAKERHERRVRRVDRSEASRPPVAARVRVGARADEQVDHLALLRLDRMTEDRAAEAFARRGIVQPR